MHTLLFRSKLFFSYDHVKKGQKQIHICVLTKDNLLVGYFVYSPCAYTKKAKRESLAKANLVFSYYLFGSTRQEKKLSARVEAHVDLHSPHL